MAHYIKGKGWFESGGQKIGSARTVALHQARVLGFLNDKAGFTRLSIEARVSRHLLLEAWRKGRAQAESADLPAA